MLNNCESEFYWIICGFPVSKLNILLNELGSKVGLKILSGNSIAKSSIDGGGGSNLGDPKHTDMRSRTIQQALQDKLFRKGKAGAKYNDGDILTKYITS